MYSYAVFLEDQIHFYHDCIQHFKSENVHINSSDSHSELHFSDHSDYHQKIEIEWGAILIFVEVILFHAG